MAEEPARWRLRMENFVRATGLLPSRSATGISITHLGWNYTTVLDVVAAVSFAVVYWLYRTRPASERYAQDPVCGMQVEIAHAPASAIHSGETVYFCSDHCAHRYGQGQDAQRSLSGR